MALIGCLKNIRFALIAENDAMGELEELNKMGIKRAELRELYAIASQPVFLKEESAPRQESNALVKKSDKQWGMKEGANMNPSVGFWDSLFGERITLEVPSSDGGARKVQVTKKWVEKMEREGKMKKATPSLVRVNILDPIGD